MFVRNLYRSNKYLHLLVDDDYTYKYNSNLLAHSQSQFDTFVSVNFVLEKIAHLCKVSRIFRKKNKLNDYSYHFVEIMSLCFFYFRL